MNNRRSLKENLTISNKQRFSIRKFSIGVASVMLGTTLYFMGGVGTSIVHADSVQGQSVQTSNLDTNSAQASSDTSSAEQTSSQNQTSSAQNSQKAVSNASSNTESTDSKTQTSDQVDNATTDKNEASQADNATTDKNEASQADNASATNIKTRDNKKVVSDANRAKSTANDTQTKPAQQTAKSDAANSNTLVVQRTKKLTVNAKLLADSKAQTDTKTDSNYSVTDNYPKDLMTYLPSDFNNKQEYAFEWLQNENNNNIILTTNRTGDGEVYVYQDGKKVGTLAKKSSAKKSSCSLQDTIVDNWGYDHTIKIGTVYNDDYAGIVQSNNGYLLNIIYSSHAKDVDNAGSSYSTVSFFVPHKIKQTVTYKNSKGIVIDRLTHTQYGLTGQSYTTGLPSGSDYVRKDEGEYLDNITKNSSGLISEFHDGYTCTKDYHDGVKVTFTENDSEGIGAMDYVVKDHGKEVKSGILKYGNSAEYDKYAWNGWDWYKSHSYTIVNPYVPQTTNIVYQYKKLGQVITTDPSGNKKCVYYNVNYTNDQSDPIKIEPVNAKPITGYSAIVKYENKIVSDKNFMPKNLGENTYITYIANDQKATITYIDDTTKTNLDSKDASGKFGQAITFTTAPTDEIANYKKQGYKLVSNDFNDNKYQADNNKNVFYVHLKHGTKKVSRNDDVTMTVHYVMDDNSAAPSDHKQTVNFTENGIQDLVTQKITWTPAVSQTLKDVDSPVLTGYTADIKTANGKVVNFGDDDVEVTVTYHANAQTATITYIDDTEKKTLSSDNQNGKFNQTITFEHDPAEVIKGLEEKGYVFVSNTFDNQKYQADNSNNVFEVHFVHGTKNVSRNDDVNMTVHYVMDDNSEAPSDNKQTVNFTENGIQDLVTKHIDWTTANSQTFKDVATPKMTGYTPDQDKVTGPIVNFGDKDINVTVTYHANTQTATITYIDDTTKTNLKSKETSGKFGQAITFATAPTDEIAEYEKQGYVLVSNSFDNNKYQADNNNNVFYVHFIHGNKKVSRTDDINMTVHYVMDDNSAAPSDHKQTLSFTENGIQDLVTKHIDWTTANSQTFKDVATPKMTGYTPDQDKVTGPIVNFGDKDINVTVTYHANMQTATITYIDDTTKTNLDSKDASGKFGQAITFTTVPTDEIANYKKQGYKLVSNDFNSNKYQADNSKNVFHVHFIHDTKKVSRTDDINMTVHYVMDDNSAAPSDHKQTVNFTENGIQDLVTQKITWTPADSQTLNDVVSPVLTGYTADIKTANGKVVNFGDPDINVIVHYSANAQTATITYIDDTDKKTLGSDSQNGKFNQAITFEHDPAAKIASYEKQGYVLVSNSFDNNKYQADDNNNVFYVHLKHGTKKVSRNDDVTMTVHYVMDDNSKAPSDNKQTVNFTEDGIQDLVTKHIDWTPAESQTLKDVTSPVLTGYIADIKTANGKVVNFGDDDVEVTVTYHANAQTATITYIDDTTKTNLDSKDTSGKFGQAITFATAPADEIAEYEKQGYVFVSNSFDNNKYQADNNNNVFYVHFIHGNKKVNREHSASFTVHYIYKNGKQAKPDYEQTLSFTENGSQDLVTQKITWTPADSQKFDDVATPVITGYTPDHDKVIGQTANFETDNREVTVTYLPDVQLGHINYIDDNTGKTLIRDDFSGKTNEHEDYTPNDRIQEFENKGYVFVSSDYPDGGFNFDDNDQQDQVFNVHLKHGIVTVTSKKPQIPNTTIDPDPHSPKYPEDISNTNSDVKRTIDYTFKNGKTAQPTVKDSLHFERTVVIDKVTGDVLSDTWTPSQNFNDIQTPAIQGYTPDRTVVSDKNIGHDHQDIIEHVVYNPDAQHMTITYIDDTTGETLHTDKRDGVSDQDAKYTTSDTIKQYEEQHYKLVSDSTNGKDLIFDHDDNADQTYEVHFVHGKHAIDQTTSPKQTVHYVYADGLVRQGKAADDNIQTLSFKRDGYNDEVTGIDHWNAWTPANSQYEAVDSPVIQGYTPDKLVVEKSTVNPTDKDTEVTVIYSPDAQHMTITYIDDTTGKTLHTDKRDGVSDQDAKYTTSDTIKQYEEQHYKLVSDSTNGKDLIFDHDDDADQTYEVHFVHSKHAIDQTTSPKQTIHYVYADGLVRQGKAADDNVQQLSFKRDGYNDEVTGTDHWNAWTPANSNYNAVDSPVIQGYTPDKLSIDGSIVNPTDKDIEVTVTYSPNVQLGHINYIDDSTKKTLTRDDFSGKTNEHEDYTPSDRIQEFENKGYELVSNDYPDGGFNFDANDQQDQVFNVHLKHGTITVTPENPGKPGEPVDPDNPDGPKYPAGTDKTGLTDTVNRTITYVMSDGSKAPEAVHDSLSYTASKVIDKVNGEVLETKWSANQDFKDVDSPSVKGYTPDKKTVSNKNVAHDAADITETVKYNADAQKASVTYVDDKTGKTLKVDNLNGVTNAKSGYTTKAAIDTYTGLGYILVSDDTNGNEVVFDNDDANDQAFTVHLSHGTITVTPENPGKPGEPINPGEGSANYPDGTDKTGLTDTVNRTITYVMIDGSKAPDAVHDSLSYTASKVIDKVNGEVLETKWSANQDFKDVDSPSVKGYTPDKKTVSNKNVAHDAADITETVKYNADAQKASVTYVDDKTGKTLKVDNLNGVTNAKSGYTTKAAIDTYTGLGYTLVSDDTNGKEVVFDNDDAVDQAFTVHLSHGTTTVTPDNPGHPGKPLDPDNPDGPKYPDGTEEYQVKRTGTQIIHYAGASDKTPADNKQTFIFTREITFDNVTGKIISKTPWNVQSYTFGKVDTPVIPGYHADKAVAGGETVTPDDLNKVITVTYAPDGGSGDNPGSNGGGDQGTTPTPEPTPDDQPDTKLPSDNNTDKDVEKDKQDKPEKVKKARKIIKTRITKQEHIGNAEKAEPLAEQEHNDQTVASPVKNEANEPQLPQTGEANTSVIGLLGMLVAGFAAILGFESSRSRKHKN